MSPAVLEAAQRLSGGKARPAVELLEYDAKMAPAVHYAFGNVFICQVRALHSQSALAKDVWYGACTQWAWPQDLASAHLGALCIGLVGNPLHWVNMCTIPCPHALAAGRGHRQEAGLQP